MKEFEVTFTFQPPVEAKTYTVEARTKAEARELAQYDLTMDDDVEFDPVSEAFKEGAKITDVIHTDTFPD